MFLGCPESRRSLVANEAVSNQDCGGDLLLLLPAARSKITQPLPLMPQEPGERYSPDGRTCALCSLSCTLGRNSTLRNNGASTMACTTATVPCTWLTGKARPTGRPRREKERGPANARTAPSTPQSLPSAKLITAGNSGGRTYPGGDSCPPRLLRMLQAL